MNKNQALMLAATLFGLMALGQLIRAIFESPVLINNEVEIPVYASYIAFAIFGWLSWLMLKAGKVND